MFSSTNFKMDLNFMDIRSAQIYWECISNLFFVYIVGFHTHFIRKSSQELI